MVNGLLTRTHSTSTTGIQISKEKSILVKEEYDILGACSIGKQLAAEIGIGVVDQNRIATAISELAWNILVYSITGVMDIRQLDESNGRIGLEITAADSGPGIENVEMAIKEGYSSGPGKGSGLAAVKCLMDEFSVDTMLGRGTSVTVKKWR